MTEKKKNFVTRGKKGNPPIQLTSKLLHCVADHVPPVFKHVIFMDRYGLGSKNTSWHAHVGKVEI